MIFLLSPAKRMDFESEAIYEKSSAPQFEAETKKLLTSAQKLSAKQLQNLMGVSDQLAELNYQRYKTMKFPTNLSTGRQALFAFRGDVYVGLDADSLNEKDIDFAQKHMRILSGLYGILRPLDLVQAYRLEMGLDFKNVVAKNLYGFWRDKLTEHLKAELKSSGNMLVNLASNEYWKAINAKALDCKIITPQFKEYRQGKPRVISFNAKKARGQMARYIIDNKITEAESLKNFNLDGYRFDPKLSKGNVWVFSRPGP